MGVSLQRIPVGCSPLTVGGAHRKWGGRNTIINGDINNLELASKLLCISPMRKQNDNMGWVRLGLNLAGIALIYVACFAYGQHVERKAFTAQVKRVAGKMGAQVKFADAINAAASEHHVHPALVAAVIHAESNFNPRAQSPVGAKGLMQINPPTQRHLKLRNVYDPRQNIDAGTRYLRELMNRFGGNLRMTLAAYNAGPGAVKKYAGIPPYRETRRYVKKVMKHYHTYKKVFVAHPLS